jgi:hypothetical protein
MVPDWATLTAEGQEPPSLINTLINIVLKPGSEPDNAMFASQKNVQTLVLVLVMLMVPMMLFPKPYLLNKANHKKVCSSLPFLSFYPLEIT